MPWRSKHAEPALDARASLDIGLGAAAARRGAGLGCGGVLLSAMNAHLVMGLDAEPGYGLRSPLRMGLDFGGIDGVTGGEPVQHRLRAPGNGLVAALGGVDGWLDDLGGRATDCRHCV